MARSADKQSKAAEDWEGGKNGKDEKPEGCVEVRVRAGVAYGSCVVDAAMTGHVLSS